MTVDRHGPAEELWNSPAGKRCVGAYTEAAKARLRLPWPDDPAQRGVDPTPFSPPVDEVPEVRAVLDQLIGLGCWGGGMEPGGPDAEPADCLVVCTRPLARAQPFSLGCVLTPTALHFSSTGRRRRPSGRSGRPPRQRTSSRTAAVSLPSARRPAGMTSSSSAQSPVRPLPLLQLAPTPLPPFLPLPFPFPADRPSSRPS